MENFNFGWAAFGLTIILNILPIFSFINFFGKKTNLENITFFKILSNYANCLIWYFYGSIIFINEIKISNMISGFISLIFIIIYLLIESKKYFLNTIFNSIIVIIGTMSAFKWFDDIFVEKDIVGKACLIITIISILTQVPEIYTSINTKNYLSIRINYSIISFPTYFCWIVFGSIIRDKYVLIANLIAIIFSFTTILLYSYYKKDYPIFNDRIKVSTIQIVDDSKKYINWAKERPVEIINIKKL